MVTCRHFTDVYLINDDLLCSGVICVNIIKKHPMQTLNSTALIWFAFTRKEKAKKGRKRVICVIWVPWRTGIKTNKRAFTKNE